MADIYVNVIIINNYSKNIPLTGEINLYFNGHESVSLLLDDSLSWGNTTTWKSIGKGTTTYNNRKLIPSKNSSEAPSPDSYIGKAFDNNDKAGGIYITDELFNTSWGHICVYVDGTGEALADGNTYTLTINENNATLAELASNNGGNSGGNSGGDSGGTSTSDNDSDTYNRYPSISPAGWETYGKGKRAELMYASIIPGCTDSCFFMTKYFYFAGVTNKEVTLHYITDNPSESTAKRYVFYEIDGGNYGGGLSSNESKHYYRIDGVFGGLGLTKNYSFSGGTRNGKIDEYQYLGTTSEPDYIGNYVSSINSNNKYSPLYKILLIAQEVGDSSAREPTKGLNHGRVRPLGNTDTSKGYRQPNNPIGNPFNGFSINTLKARFTDNTAQFKSSISSDEVHADGPTSWPSGHSSQCWAMAMVIVQLYGLKYNSTNNSTQQEKIISTICKYVHKAYKFGVLRTIGRFHWNSDTMYGKIFGSMIMPILNSSYDSNSGAPESFNELFDDAANELFSGDTLTKIDTIPSIDTAEIQQSVYSGWFDEFKEIINTIAADSSVTPVLNDNNISESIFGYLWYMYKAGRVEVESNTTKVFNFFNDNNTQFYPGDDEESYFDEEQGDPMNINIDTIWDNYRSWFPEVFPKNHPQKLNLLQEGNETTITYHGSNSSYYKNGDYRANISGLTRSKILCSWLMAFCLSELYISKGSAGNTSNQTKIFASAYNMCGGRELNFYDEYSTTHDPVYLRLAAGIIYCFNRGKFNHQTIYNLGNKGGPQLDSNSDNTIEPKEANTQVGNDIDKGLRSEAGAWAQATVNYGVDNYFIFPNAPGPYVPGRQFSKPFEKNSYKPGDYSKVQGETQFIVPGVKIVNPNNEGGGGGGSSTTEIVYSGQDTPAAEEIIITSGSSNSLSGNPLYSIGLISDLHLNYQDDRDGTKDKESGLYYDEEDLAKVLQILKSKEVSFICGCGDITEASPYYQDKLEAISDSEYNYLNKDVPDSVEPYKVKSKDAMFDDADNFYNVYTKNCNGLNFYTPLGNHDFRGLYEALETDTTNISNLNETANGSSNKGFNESVYDRITNIWFEKIHNSAIIGNKSIHYFRYNNSGHGNGTENLSGWNYDDGGVLNNYSKLNFWFDQSLSNGKKDRYIFMSIDYGNDLYKGGNKEHDWHDRKIRARNIISGSDTYITAMKSYAAEGGYNNNDTYDYQFYHPNVLIWLKEIIENSQSDETINNIYVFSHHFLPNKVGNNLNFPKDGYWGYGYAYPKETENNNDYNLLNDNDPNTNRSAESLITPAPKVLQGASYLSGVQFYFLNRLNNLYKNVIFFSGHSHITWTKNKNNNNESTHVTSGKDYDFYKEGDSYENADKKAKLIYTRKSNTSSTVTGGNWVALPAGCKPSYGDEPSKGSANTHRDEAEFTIMEIYENGVKLKGYNMVRTEVSTGGGGSVGNIPIYESNSSGDARIRFINGMEDGEDAWLNGKLTVYFFGDSSSAGNGASGSVNSDNNIILGNICGANNPALANVTYDNLKNTSASTAEGGGGGQDYVMKYSDGTYVPGSYSNKDGAYILNKIRLKTNEYVEAKIPNEFVGKYFGTWEKITAETGSNPAIKLACTNYGYHGSDKHRITDSEIGEYTSKSTTWGEYYAWKGKYWPVDTGPNLVVNPIKNSDGSAIKVENGKTYYAVITGYTATVTPLATNHYRISHNEQWPDYSLNQIEEGTHITGYGKLETSNSNSSSGSSSNSTLGNIYIDIKVKNTTNHDIYITERFKFFPIAVKDGKEFWGYFYLLGTNFTNYANIKISSGETKTFSHENLRWDTDATLKDVTNNVDSTEPASYLNGITLNNGLEDAIGVYTYFNSSGSKTWGKLLPVQTKNGDNYIRQVSPNTWNIGTAGNITVYTIEVTDDNDTYWTTPNG